ncbi:hypothetical protein PYH58_13120 [Mammaliicoccus sciuri]|uniref:hypothetical protein n=1 Tax=Mammaliicoccus sciuri TaxID=1296 RepID=UPI0033650EF1
MKIKHCVFKVCIILTLVFTLFNNYEHTYFNHQAETKTLSKYFTTTKSAPASSALPSKIYYSQRLKVGVGYVTYKGYLYKTGVKRVHNKYVGTYSGNLPGRWS